MITKHLAVLCTLFLATPCSLTIQADPTMPISKQKNKIDLQGHRGARGSFPENTIPAFLHALDLGVTTLEMDVVISGQGSVFLSHEPWMSASICTHPDGRIVTKKDVNYMSRCRAMSSSVRRRNLAALL